MVICNESWEMLEIGAFKQMCVRRVSTAASFQDNEPVFRTNNSNNSKIIIIILSTPGTRVISQAAAETDTVHCGNIVRSWASGSLQQFEDWDSADRDLMAECSLFWAFYPFSVFLHFFWQIQAEGPKNKNPKCFSPASHKLRAGVDPVTAGCQSKLDILTQSLVGLTCSRSQPHVAVKCHELTRCVSRL